MLADLIVANQYVRYLTDFHGKDVYIVTDDAPNFRCNNINRILINGKLTYADNYVSGQDIYDITHLAEGINFISTNNTYDENEYAYLIYKATVKLEVQLRHRLPSSLKRSGKGEGRRW